MPWIRSKYPKDWAAISLACRARAGWKCERCGAKQGELTERSKRLGLPWKVVLTAAHTGPNKHNKADCSHLEALCQRCHLKEDMADHVRHAHETRRRKREAAGQLPLFEVKR